jgi:hypothetical protein
MLEQRGYQFPIKVGNLWTTSPVCGYLCEVGGSRQLLNRANAGWQAAIGLSGTPGISAPVSSRATTGGRHRYRERPP